MSCPQPRLTQMWMLPLTIMEYVLSRPPEGCSLKILASILMVKGLWEASPESGCLWHEHQLADRLSQPEGESGGIHTAILQFHAEASRVEHPHPHRTPELHHLLWSAYQWWGQPPI